MKLRSYVFLVIFLLFHYLRVIEVLDTLDFLDFTQLCLVFFVNEDFARLNIEMYITFGV